MMIRFISTLFLLFLLLASHQAGAVACTTKAAAASFGSKDSFSVSATPQIVETSTGFDCSNLASILGTNTFTAVLSNSTNRNGAQPRLYNSATGTYISYSACQDSGCGTPNIIGTTPGMTWTVTSLLGLLGLFNSDGTLPIYIRTNNVNVPAGTYVDTLTLQWDYSICTGLGIGSICIGRETYSTTTSIDITLVVTNSCLIDTAPNISFGAAALPASFGTINSSLGVRCTLSAPFQVNLSSSNPIVNNWRQMSNTANSPVTYLQYQLYKSDNSVWTNTENISLTGTGLAQNISYSAKINAAQSPVMSGSYSDTVTVTLSY